MFLIDLNVGSNKDNRKVWINIEKIICFTSYDNKTYITLEGVDEACEVAQTIKEILERIPFEYNRSVA